MNQRILSGVLLLSMALATVGAAVNAEGDTSSSSDAATLASEVIEDGSLDALGTENAVEAKVPVRSGLLSEQTQGSSESAEAARPVSVRIGDINVDAPVLSVGVDQENRFAVPAADTVGWYKYSSLPGTAGATVLAAHVDYGGRPGAFFNLRELREGDRLEVDMSDGSTLVYQVTGNTQYDKSELPAEELFRKEGEPVLQLITCGGTFDPNKRSYEANVVITARPITA